MKKNIYLLIILIFLKGVCFAGDEGACAIPFLKIPVGARAASLGGAFAAISDDASAVFNNIAGMSFVRDKELLLSHNQWIEGISGETLAYVYPLNSKFSLGAGANILLSGSMKKYDLSGTETGEFNYSEGAFVAAISGKIIPQGSIGLGLKSIYQKSGNKNAGAYALDIGVTRGFYEEFRAGLTVENIGAKIKLEDESFSIPLGFKLGIAYIPLDHGFITTQIKKYSDEDMSFALGSEYNFKVNTDEAGFLRAIYSFDAENIASGINLGLGLKAKNFFIDYAFAPMGDFGSAHRLSLRIVFKQKDEASDERNRGRGNDDSYDFFGW
ncbi:MAG: PorV/PorQ family protein [Elusimicrobiales bacterium]|nr:PorV/PorQ family protein [Elusimicrobiales bacterium]